MTWKLIHHVPSEELWISLLTDTIHVALDSDALKTLHYCTGIHDPVKQIKMKQDFSQHGLKRFAVDCRTGFMQSDI